ncbi:flagellar hook-basal body complex protein FliE [Starkeya koreensis]|uniref:Flagellar hook-basal body complex protein FliE n=1 Tax=Ancylobacter koreensis TaxID=266121 RepID=A0ABT0DKS9_9HYPH|nr:flagellar hook-basal body complex protein FliE [Ancylobacter koreensis]MCK0207908.1 flagellar hook-basal body complex protein FliE [Ancylobacter koreensis]
MLDALNSLTSLRGPAAASATSATGASAAVAQPRAVSGADFTDVLADVSGQAVNALKGAEATAITGIQGRASVQQVVQSIMAAEETLQTALAVRDKVVAAYQEISRMAI